MWEHQADALQTEALQSINNWHQLWPIIDCGRGIGFTKWWNYWANNSDSINHFNINNIGITNNNNFFFSLTTQINYININNFYFISSTMINNTCSPYYSSSNNNISKEEKDSRWEKGQGQRQGWVNIAQVLSTESQKKVLDGQWRHIKPSGL